MAEDVPQWSDEVVAEAFRTELRERFEAHNAAYRAREAAELEQVLREHPEKHGQPGYEVCDSFAWEVYSRAVIDIDRNSVTIVMPQGFALRTDLLPLFDHTAMAWSRPIIGATIVDGEARPTIKIMLVATWTDEMDAKWRAEGNARRRVEVGLFMDELTKLCMLLDAFSSPLFTADEARELRDRLRLSLEALP